MNEPTSPGGEINHRRTWPGIVSGASCAVLAAALLAFSAAMLWQRIELIDVLVLRSMVRTLCWVVLPGTGLVLLLAGVRLLRSEGVSRPSQERNKFRVPAQMITALLIAVLIVPAGSATGQQSAPPPPPTEEKASSIVEALMMAIIVAIIGYTLIRILINVCNKCLPPAKEPPPKPPPSNTNGSPAWASSLPLAGTLSVTNLAAWDVTAWATNADWEDPDGNYFTVFFTNRIEAAANATFSGNTESITLHGWVSTNWIEVLVLDSRLSPVATNLSPRSTVPIVESGLAGGPQQFFRIALP